MRSHIISCRPQQLLLKCFKLICCSALVPLAAMTTLSPAYFRAICEHVDLRALNAVKKDVASNKKDGKERTVGLFYDRSMLTPKFLSEACVEHAALLHAIIAICTEPALACLRSALERLNGQHGEALFDKDEDSEFGTRLQAQGLRLMISHISKRNRNMRSGERSSAELVNLAKNYEKCR